MNKKETRNMMHTFVPRILVRFLVPVWTTPLGPMVIETLYKVPPFPHLGQNIRATSDVTFLHASHLRAHLHAQSGYVKLCTRMDKICTTIQNENFVKIDS